MDVNLGKENIKQTVNRWVALSKVKQMSLPAWEKTYAKVQAEELLMVRALCRIQGLLDSWKKNQLWASRRLHWWAESVDSEEGNEEHEDVGGSLLEYEFRERCQFWIKVAYLRKTMPGRNMKLSDEEKARMASFHTNVEYSMGSGDDGPVEWFQLHDLALDHWSAIRAVMDGSVSLFPLEEEYALVGVGGLRNRSAAPSRAD
ncbi:Nn.00g068390.m01.CDS01 [Neocucurbitaria sp. VM-36]